MKTFVRSAILLLVAVIATFALSSWTGKVVGVTDGDTIEVMHDGKAEKIRFHGIDAPEAGQPWGNKAKQLVSKLAFGQEVRIDPTDTDKYGRTVARIFLPDGRELNKVLVQEGLAWWYKEYAEGDKELEALENEAKSMGRGLWSDANPIAPWDWRHGKTTTEETKDNAVSAADNKSSDAGSEQVFKTATGKKYHRDGCRYLKSRIPTTVKDAVAAGLTPCAVCCPPTLDAADSKPSSSTIQEAQPAPSYQSSGRCQAITKKGTQCKRSAKPGSNYCWQHGG